jgi:uncharacterized protein YfiM (DUF2279 family)
LVLAVAILLMCCAALTLVWDGSRAASSAERRAVAARGCRLGVVSSLLLAVAGVACLDGPASAWGWAMIFLGLAGATAGYLVFRRYLTEAGWVRSVR